ncbi:Mbov_0400 family ICE element protein [Mycoplasma putrefaciens]|uniref:Mbov_0400 family ICE element protein n=1 Tax=Mycoplasma putrefaciens TaxID=2123 RepID=UPI0003A058F9|nr:hypothetical protein [Mycoplasma putrefaciens]
MSIEIGKVYKERLKNLNFPIAKNRNDTLVDDHGINRPYIVFFSDEKVYYLSAKSISKKNKKATLKDKFNIVFKKDLYGEEREIAINCSVINVMDRKLFESLYVKDDDKNNFQTDTRHYDRIMAKLYEVFDEITYAEVSHIKNDTNELIWKSTLESRLNKLDCLMIIKGYNYLLFDSNMPRADLLNDSEKFYSIIKQFYEQAKFKTQSMFNEYVVTQQNMQSIKYELEFKEAISKLQKDLEIEKEDHKLLQQQIIERQQELAKIEREKSYLDDLNELKNILDKDDLNQDDELESDNKQGSKQTKSCKPKM